MHALGSPHVAGPSPSLPPPPETALAATKRSPRSCGRKARGRVLGDGPSPSLPPSARNRPRRRDRRAPVGERLGEGFLGTGVGKQRRPPPPPISRLLRARGAISDDGGGGSGGASRVRGSERRMDALGSPHVAERSRREPGLDSMCRLLASCRGNYHVEDLEGDLVRRKRMRWAQETDAEENIGGLGQRYHAWDREIIPERMPDCSYFLQGLCTNTRCPYRHLNVHPDASICEGFLKGYCADGDECHKQHSFVCPLYKSTGKCLQATKCRLHHPKIKRKCKERKDFMPRSNSWGRYFGSSIREAGEPLVTSSYKDDMHKDEDLFCYEGHFTDFISLGPKSNDGDASPNVLMDLSEPQYGSIDSALQRHDLEMLIKPLWIMRKEYTVQSPAADCS